MQTYPNTPGVQIQEVRLDAPPIQGVGTSTAGFVGKGPKSGKFTNTPRLVTSLDQFINDYIADATTSTPLSRAVTGFFQNGGMNCYVVNTDSDVANDVTAGIKLLEVIDEIAILAAPGYTASAVNTALVNQATALGDRFAILDSPAKVDALNKLTPGDAATVRPADAPGGYAAFYYPRVQVPKQLSADPASEFVTPVGHIAGLYALTDTSRGVHKAPANAALAGVLGVEHRLTDSDQNAINLEGVNVLRVFNGNVVVWGGRTLLASTATDPTFKYINVRRLVNYVEESLQDGLRWAVFEPNTLQLRQQITRAVRGFLDGLWRDGALFGATTNEAYYVRFPEIFNSDADRANGKLTVEIGLRVTYPAEFIIIRIGLLLQSAATA